jgi:hypothetical protein
MTLFDTLLSDFFGNPVLMSVGIIFVFILLVLFIRTSKYVIEGIALLAVYGMMKAGFIESWVLFIVIALIGLDIAKSILVSFIRS